MINNLIKLPGGVGDQTPTNQIDPIQLSTGIQIEMEHTNDLDIAKEIAMDHLTEDPKYYSKLVDAGLASEFKPGNGTGFGDSSTGFNDSARIGAGGLKKGNMHGKIGNTPDGRVDGRRSEPVVNKTIDIELEEQVFSSLEEAMLDEKKRRKSGKGKRKPKPTNPALWARAKSAARSKFDVYPSAYANGWAAKWYKSKGGGSNSKSARNNPIVISSDLTSAQNLDKSFTGIINIGTSRSSMTGTASWGVTSMVWLNFKQFALNGRYTKIHFSGNGKLKWVHNINATALYSYGNYMSFIGYSAILNAGKWGITGMNVSGMITKVTDEKNLFISPSITAFYTRPFQSGKKLTISPELYIISTPLVYSSFDKVTVSDRTFSGFLGSGFDYQFTRRFKINVNYKANLSTNPEFPILSFFLVGSKINL